MDRRNWTDFCIAGCLFTVAGLLTAISSSAFTPRLKFPPRHPVVDRGPLNSSAQSAEIPVQPISRQKVASAKFQGDAITQEIPRIPGTAVAEQIVALSPAESADKLIVGNLADSDSQRQFQVTIVRLGPDDSGRLISSSNSTANEPRIAPGASHRGSTDLSSARTASLDAPLKSGVRTTTFATNTNPEKRERTFFLHTGRGELDQPSGYELLKTELIAEGTHCRLWRDTVGGAEEADSARTIHEESAGADWLAVADPLIAALQAQWGPWRDVDGDGKLGIVMTPRLQHFRGGQTALKGLVNPNDWEPAIPRPFGNAADVVYVSSTLDTDSLRRTILTHELCHAWLCGQRAAARLAPEEDWLNEGLAHWCELRWAGDWTNLDFRASRFFNEPERYPLVVPNYYHSPFWRDHGCRGAGFLFLQFLTETQGDSVVRKLIAHPRGGMAKCAELCQQPFDELFRDWTIWLAGWEARERLAADDLHPETATEPTSPLPFPQAYRPYAAGRFLLAGPRPHELCLDAGDVGSSSNGTSSAETIVTIRGSAAAFIQLQGGSPGRYRIRVEDVSLNAVATKSTDDLASITREPFQVTLLSQPRRQQTFAAQPELTGNAGSVLVWEQHDRDFHASGLLPGGEPPCAFSAQPVRHVVSRPDLPVVVKQLRLEGGRLTCHWKTLAAADLSSTATPPIPLRDRWDTFASHDDQPAAR